MKECTMSEYKAPVTEANFVLEEHVGIAAIAALPGFEEVTPDLIEAVVQGAAALTEEVIAPLSRKGDMQGTRVENRQVVQADGFKEAYTRFVEGGWNSLPLPSEFGGQGLPLALAAAVQEMVKSADLAFSLCPMLTQGAIDALLLHGSEALQQTYLRHMVAGSWTGTMNLTEPQAGSDLAAVRTRAERDGDRYRIFGQKIFIT
jgi:3-(methylthio)propanoyl-CoA dehydrogenase